MWHPLRTASINIIKEVDNVKTGYGFTEFENDYMEFYAYENGKTVELNPKEKQGYIDLI